MNTTHPSHKNVTIPLRRRGGPSGHGRVGVVPADPAPRQFECPPKADVSRTTVVTAFSAITSRYTLLSSRTRSDARTLHHPPSTIHRAPHTTQSPNRSPLNYSPLNYSITQQPSSDFRPAPSPYTWHRSIPQTTNKPRTQETEAVKNWELFS